MRFSASQGSVLNEFYRQGPVAAHLVITSGRTPRLVVAFPAGNSGVGLWFDSPQQPLSWNSSVKIDSASRALAEGGVLNGITAELSASGGPIALTRSIASNVRVLRDFQDADLLPTEVLVAPQVSKRLVTWTRRRLDGRAGYSVSLEMLSGSISGGTEQSPTIRLSPGPGGKFRLRLTALTGDPPLTPIDAGEVLNAGAADDARLRDILAFLSYDEKLLAGSWRFNTYFGRDTLMSLRLLAPVLRPRVLEAGLASVLERLNAAGEVAHEEDIGEFAVLRRLRAGEPLSDAPILDYKMIDDDYMLSIVAAHYLLDMNTDRARAEAFLARVGGSGDSYGARLVANMRFVLTMTAPFAREPVWQRLVALKPGEQVGNWRDSNDGLGGGKYPYDVNGVFAPAALAAIGRLHASGLLRPYLNPEGEAALADAARMGKVWLQQAPRLFDVAVGPDQARVAAREYGSRIGVDPSPGVDSLETTIRFRAVALDAEGRAVPVLNSDEAFALLLLDLDPAEAQRIAAVLTRSFPAGLLTDVGLVVANPAYAAQSLEERFDRSHYHGTVIWSWQQGLLVAGLERQLARADLTALARRSLTQSRDRLLAAMREGQAIRGSELWSWSVVHGRYRLVPFGQREQDETESNAAQLWSTVPLARPGG